MNAVFMFSNRAEKGWWWDTELLLKSIAYGLSLIKYWYTNADILKYLQNIKHFIRLKHEIMKKNEYINVTPYPSHQHV